MAKGASVRIPGPGEDPREWAAREALRQGKDYADEIYGQPVPGVTMDAVSAAVVKNGGAAVYVEGWRSPEIREEPKYLGEPTEKVRFGRYFPSLRLALDIAESDPRVRPDPEKRAKCHRAGVAYAVVCTEWRQSGIELAVADSIEKRRAAGEAPGT